MRLFNCKVRVAGNLLNEVRKTDVTAAEITVLRVIHNPPGGEDSVLDIKPTGKDATDDVDGREVPRSDKAERARLEAIYGEALKTIADVKSLNGVFGVATPLPKTVDGVVGEVELAEPPKRTKVTAAKRDEFELEAAA